MPTYLPPHSMATPNQPTTAISKTNQQMAGAMLSPNTFESSSPLAVHPGLDIPPSKIHDHEVSKETFLYDHYRHQAPLNTYNTRPSNDSDYTYGNEQGQDDAPLVNPNSNQEQIKHVFIREVNGPLDKVYSKIPISDILQAEMAKIRLGGISQEYFDAMFNTGKMALEEHVSLAERMTKHLSGRKASVCVGVADATQILDDHGEAGSSIQDVVKLNMAALKRLQASLAADQELVLVVGWKERRKTLRVLRGIRAALPVLGAVGGLLMHIFCQN